VLNDQGRSVLSPVRWPQHGQAALVFGNGRLAASPDEQPVAIGSRAKVMTAYLTLKRYSLSGPQDGHAITVTAAQAQAAGQDARQGQSVGAVRAGEQLTERQLMEAPLIPSGNNIAGIPAAGVAGSEARCIAEMNAEARALGMDQTIYTDPSGFAPSTVSTSAAGGCLAFFTHVTVGGRGRLRSAWCAAGGREHHIGGPHRRGRGRPAAGRLRRAGDSREHDRCARWPRRRRWAPWPPAATRSPSPLGPALMSTRSLPAGAHT
jgi:D-alanyl-D-alanine carboxypeptidase